MSNGIVTCIRFQFYINISIAVLCVACALE